MQPSEVVPEWVKAAKAGDKVFCWRMYRRPSTPVWIQMPVEGQIYTIRAIYVGYSGLVGIHLAEIVNEPVECWGRNGLDTTEIGFDCRYFRPLTGKPTDISCFTDMLKTTPAGTTVPAAEQVPA